MEQLSKNPEIPILLKKVVNPVPLYVMDGNLSDYAIPVKNQRCGFDLFKHDWIAPHGKGERADIFFNFIEKPRHEAKVEIFPSSRHKTMIDVYDESLEVTFPLSFDGIQSYYAPPRPGSELRLPRLAPEDGYQSKLVRRRYLELEGNPAA